MITLSIIMPVYNGERFLAQQIESILSQTRDQFELLVIDDGSTDMSAHILDEYVRRDRRVARIHSTGNLGQRVRLRQLCESATGEFLAIADQDDLWASDRNEHLLNSIGKHALAFGRSQLIDEDGQDLQRTLLDAVGIDPWRLGPLRSLLRPAVSAHASLVRRSWLDIAVFSGSTHFDATMALEAMLSDGLIYENNAIVFHRMHDSNQSNKIISANTNVKLVSPYRLKKSTSFVLLERLSLFIIFEQLGKSLAVRPEARVHFAAAASECRYTWFQPMNWTPGKARRLESRLHALLDQFAQSEAELQEFIAQLRSVTRSQLSPTNVAESMRRYYRDWREETVSRKWMNSVQGSIERYR